MQTKSFVHLRREDLRRVRRKKGEQGNKEHPFGKKNLLTVGKSYAIPTWH
jgi:hypothetical protein